MPGDDLDHILQEPLVIRLLVLHGFRFKHLLLPDTRQILLMLDQKLYYAVVEIVKAERL